MLVGIAWALALAAAVLAFAYAPKPYIWIDFAVFAAIIVTAVRLRRASAKTVAACLAAIVFAVGALETYQSFKGRANVGESESVDLEGRTVDKHQPHDLLGWALAPGMSGVRTKRRGDEIVFIERFTIDDNGLRVSAPDRGGPDIECILFFGGSFTYGNGLLNEETLPYQVGVRLDGRYRTHNFAAGGYGPHQMLAALETGFVEDVIECTTKYVIYQAIDDHLWRASGHAFWERRGPRYALVDGDVELRGNFDDPLEWSFDWHNIFRAIDRSVLYKKVFGGRIRQREFELFIPLVAKAARTAEDLFPDSEFHVILHNQYKPELDAQIVAALQARGVRVHTLNEIAGGEPLRGSRFYISGDGHPTALTNDLIAAYVVDKIIDR